MKRVLVLSPHPDDEAIGCGGTLCRHADEGDEVRVIFLTSGEHGGHGLGTEQTRRTREAEAADAARVLGVQSIEFWGEPDGSLHASAELVDRLRQTIAGWHPAVVYAPHADEAHPDHRATTRLVVDALKGAAGSPTVEVRMFEVWTPIQRPSEIVDISKYIDTKIEAIRAYRSQCAVMDFDEAARGLARYRGEFHCWPGGDYAEAFAAWTLG